ncbi:hypothetical protein ADK18_03330 [Bacillus anthracis]|nr:hypothetical protein ADK18_03330 [Bacillus anthracis]
MALLKVEDLKVYFPIKGGVFGRTFGYVRAVDGVSFVLFSLAKCSVSLGNLEAENRRLEKQLCT